MIESKKVDSEISQPGIGVFRDSGIAILVDFLLRRWRLNRILVQLQIFENGSRVRHTLEPTEMDADTILTAWKGLL